MNLVDIGIGNNGAIVLVEALEINTTVTSSTLVENGLGDKGIHALVAMLETNAALIELDQGNSGASALAEALETNNTLTKLDLYGNNIGSNRACALEEVLRTNTTLTFLSLRDNDIGGDQGAAALAKALKTNTVLVGRGGREPLTDGSILWKTYAAQLSLQYLRIGDNKRTDILIPSWEWKR